MFPTKRKVNGPSAATLLVATSIMVGCAMPMVPPASGGATTASVDGARVTGTVTYLQRIALPSTAVVKVQLVDVSRADALAVVLGEQVIVAGGRQVPFALAVTYDPAKIVANHSYAVQSRIEDDGKLRFISDQRYPVITRGAPTHVDLVLKAVGGA